MAGTQSINTSYIKIPYQQANDPVLARVFNLFQTQLATSLQPITSLPMATSTIITNQILKQGINTIQTSLGYPLSGWYIIRQREQASIWDSQDSNLNPSTTLILNVVLPSGASYTSISVDLVVF